MILRMMDTNIDNKYTKKSCYHLLDELLYMTEHSNYENNNKTPSRIIINKIFETEKCSYYYDLTDLRQNYKNNLGDSYWRLIENKEDEQVEYKASITLASLHRYTKKELKNKQTCSSIFLKYFKK